MIRLQEWIHQLEVGGGVRVVRVGAAILGFLVLAGLYNWREYRNFATEEAMDQAQVARHLAAGRGFSTDFVRPISVALLERRAAAEGGGGSDPARLKGDHPDLANAPLWPVVLAGLMRVLPMDYGFPEGVLFRTYQPEVLIALFNQFLFFVAVLMTFFLARRLFDPAVAWLSALAFAGTDLLWRFSVSGLSTVLLQIWFLLLVWGLVRAEESARDPNAGFGRAWLLAAGCGLVVGLGALTRYSFGWLVGAVALCFVIWFPRRRLVLGGTVLGVFLAVMAPWLVRNVTVGGTLFGTAGFAITQETVPFPGDSLVRSLKIETGDVHLQDYLRKGLVGGEGLLAEPLQVAGGNWLGVMFLAGLLLPFVNPARSRLRLFLVGALAILAVAQILGRTHLSAGGAGGGGVHSENLLVVAAPLVLVFGAALCAVLSEQLGLLPHVQRWLLGGVVAVVSLPLVFTFLPPRSFPLAYPPYAPTLVERCASWMEKGELMMSDIPWAVAWYGDRQCMWTTLRATEPGHVQDFYAVNDLRKTVKGLYLTQVTLEGKLFSDTVGAGEGSWGQFVATSLFLKKVPTGFPLNHAPAGYLDKGQFFLSDHPRWGGTGK